MSVFGPKEPCPSCGQKVKRPKDHEDFLCPLCGKPGPWATDEQRARWTTREDARARYAGLLERLGNDALPGDNGPDLAAASGEAGYSAEELARVNAQAFCAVATRAVSDDLLTPEENTQLSSLITTLSITRAWVDAIDSSLQERVLVSSINGGILPEVASPHILAKKGEVVYFECDATLMKEVAIREYQGGYQGFSFPIGKTGVRYRVGGSRGHSVEVGTKLDVADSGILSITNKRAIYLGSRKTVEMPYAKLANLTVFSDGLQFHQSNRVNAPLFRIPRGADVAAAIVNAASQRTEATDS
jgi:predicted RNA-binding Zn-ribbon protein involved in translation (DUF1610 family)